MVPLPVVKALFPILALTPLAPVTMIWSPLRRNVSAGPAMLGVEKLPLPSMIRVRSSSELMMRATIMERTTGSSVLRGTPENSRVRASGGNCAKAVSRAASRVMVPRESASSSAMPAVATS